MAEAKKDSIGKKITKWYGNMRKRFEKYALEVPYVALVLGYFYLIWVPVHLNVWHSTQGFLLASLPFVLPVLLGILLFNAWLEYKRQQEYWSTEHCVLEIRLPEEITQGPRAAELMLRVLYQTGEVDTEAHQLLGKTKPWFSLEIVSTEGEVRFYIWMRARYKEVVKAQVYAHYPTVQVAEVEDYTLNVPFDHEKYELWGIVQSMQKPDPYPIMTYVAWGLDKADTKEEFKNDPLISQLEFFGSLGKGEHAWSQIIIRGHTKCPRSVTDGGFHEELTLEEWTQKEIDKLGGTYVDEDASGKFIPNFQRLTQGDRLKIEAMQLKLNKQVFDVGIRTVYIAEKEFNKNIRRSGFPTMFRSFEHGSEGRGLNGLKPIFFIGPFNVRWHDFMGLRRKWLKYKMYRGYVTRQFFYEPDKDIWLALNSEELASLYHFPGKVAHTPTLQRMPSRRAEAPANLPV